MVKVRDSIDSNTVVLERENSIQIELILYNLILYNFLIQHDMGINYSLFVKEIFQYILQEMFKIKLDFTITDNTVVFRFNNSSDR
jgi:hypothetical protein